MRELGAYRTVSELRGGGVKRGRTSRAAEGVGREERELKMGRLERQSAAWDDVEDECEV
jgi:hypothetical protein